MDVQIRKAGPEDAAILAEVGRDTFVETFGHLYPAADLESFLGQAYAPDAFERQLRSPREAMWLAEQDDQRLGYVHAGACGLPHPEVTSGCGEVKRLYVRALAQGSGLGGALLATALDWLEAPDRRLWIGVWSRNLGAQRLYARHGFEQVGAYRFPVGQTLDDEFILSRPGARL